MPLVRVGLLLLLTGCTYRVGEPACRVTKVVRSPIIGTNGDTVGLVVQTVRVPCDAPK